MVENLVQRYVNEVASEIVDPKGRVDPCRLREELDRRGRPSAPSPELTPIVLVYWEKPMKDVRLGCELAHPGQPDEGLHWLIQNGELNLDPDHLHPLSDTLPNELESKCNALPKDWCRYIRVQRLLYQYRLLEEAPNLNNIPTEKQSEALGGFRQRMLDRFPDWPPLSA